MEATLLDELSQQGAAATTNALAAGNIPTRQGTVTTDLLAVAPTANYPLVAQWNQACAAAQGTAPLLVGTIAGLVPQLVVAMCNADTALSSLTVQAAVNLIVAEFAAASASLDDGTLPAVGAQTAGIAAAPVGNPSFLWSAKDSAGRALQYVTPETITVTITLDAQSGATAGQEPYSVVGQNAQNNFFSWDWLKSGAHGSGGVSAGTLVDPTISNTGASTGNLTVNGGFTTWSTTNYPDNFHYVTGVATTNFLNYTGTSVYFTGAGSLEMLSAGGTKNEVWQKFNTPSSTTAGIGGSPYAFVPSADNNTQYILYFPYKLLGASPSNGTLTVRLCDSGGTTIADDSGTNNTASIDLTAVADTNWHIGSLVIRLPEVLPATTPYAISFAYTGTILDNANAVILGGVGLAVATQFYPGGPFFVGFRGSTNPNASGIFPDSWTFAVTATIGKLSKAVWRYLNPPSLGPQTPGIIIQVSNSPTIPDSLVA